MSELAHGHERSADKGKSRPLREGLAAPHSRAAQTWAWVKGLCSPLRGKAPSPGLPDEGPDFLKPIKTTTRQRASLQWNSKSHQPSNHPAIQSTTRVPDDPKAPVSPKSKLSLKDSVNNSVGCHHRTTIATRSTSNHLPRRVGLSFGRAPCFSVTQVNAPSHMFLLLTKDNR